MNADEGRLIIEMGMGADLHGRDYTKAAGRAIDDALRHSSLGILRALDIPRDKVRVQVTIGVGDPSAVDPDALVGKFPVGKVTIRVEQGGLDVSEAPGSEGDSPVVAAAAIEVFLPKQTGWRVRTES